MNLPSFLKADFLWVNNVLLLLPRVFQHVEADLFAAVPPLHHAAVLSLAAVVPGGAGGWLQGGTVGMA